MPIGVPAWAARRSSYAKGFARVCRASDVCQAISNKRLNYKIYAYGQEYADDQFDEVIAAIHKADIVVMGLPLYWHNICGLMRNFLDRCYGPIGQGEFSGKNLYFIMQGASPEKWQLEACEFTMSRFAGLYGFAYKGMVRRRRGLCA